MVQVKKQAVKTKKPASVSKAKIAAITSGVLLAGMGGGYLLNSVTTDPQAPSYGNFTSVYAVTADYLSTVEGNLAKLKVRTDNSTPPIDYDSSSMPDWKDADGNGCHTRYDVLARDMLDEKRDGCKILSGTVFDYYTGELVTYNDKVSGGGLDVDHIVAKGDAWESGGYAWDSDEWIKFANDPNELLTVSASINRQKGDKNAAEWLPPNESFQCRYVIYQVNIKHDYKLSVTTSEKATISEALNDKCEIK
jgi:hypothetical protein